MGRRSNLAMSPIHKTGKLRRSVQLPILRVAFMAIFLGCSWPALAALTCGAQPEVSPADVAEQVKSDAKDRASLIMQAPPSVDLRKFVTSQRRELRLKYVTADKLKMDSYLLWVTCQTISNDRTMAGSQQFDEYAKVYRLLSEPLDKVTAPAE